MCQRRESLLCHDSEVKKFGGAWLDQLDARARFRGGEAGFQYGEAFEVLRISL